MGQIHIVGAGLAGLSAAVTLAEMGVRCSLISQQPSERAQSVLAEGGINAVLDTMGEGDTIEEHFADTMHGGVELADPNAVLGMVSRAPEVVRWLDRLGVPFSKKDGRILARSFGGQKKKRTVYAKSSTGKIVMSALTDEVRKWEAAGNITRYPHHEVTGLILRDGRWEGLEMLDTYTGERFRCQGTVILASGGLNGLFPGWTTGTVSNTATLTGLAFQSGVALANLEFIQYHPTTVSIPGKRMLISEAARGEGGRLCILRDGSPWYFMEERYPELGNLMPRDVVSREIAEVCAREDCHPPVLLDLTGLSPHTWEGKLSDMRKEIREYLSLDPAEQMVPVSPGIHFFMGGIYVDETHQTNFPGLYAAGECACQYHGANRLGGNSMLGALYGGKIAAQNAASQEALGGGIEPLGAASESWKKQQMISPRTAKQLRDILLDGLGIVRSEAQVRASLERLREWQSQAELTKAEASRMLLGRAMLESALERRESRGAHFRTDYPERNDPEYQKTTVCTCADGEIKVEFREIPKRSGT